MRLRVTLLLYLFIRGPMNLVDQMQVPLQQQQQAGDHFLWPRQLWPRAKWFSTTVIQLCQENCLEITAELVLGTRNS